MPPITNWARNQRCHPAAVLQPASEDELRRIVADATREGKKIRVVGAHHSWSAVALTDGVLLNLDRLSGIVAVDEARHRVTVWAGTRLYALNERLAERGLALSNLGSVAQQSIAGALTCGTHGSAYEKGILATSIVGARLVLADGSVKVVDEEHDAALLDAVRVSLGALGVLSQLTVQVEPAFTLRETSTPLSIDEAIEALPAIARSAEFVKLWWLPHTPTAQVYRYERAPGPGAFSPAAHWFDERVVNGGVFPLILWLSALLPALVPLFNRLIAAVYFQARERVDRSDRLLNVPMPPRHLEMEYAVPMERAQEALQGMRALIDARGLKVNFVVEARFVAGDAAWLSPAQGRQSAYLGAYIGDCPDAVAYMDACEEVFKAVGGRPHWGKLFNQSAGELRALFPDLGRFEALRAELDPTGTFKNPFLDKVFGA